MTKFTDCTTKKARVDFIRARLSTDPRWALRALKVIFDHQTEDEKNAETTSHDNGVGFTGADAEILSSFAKQFNKWGKLSDKQMALLFKKMPKYAGQLERFSS